MVAASLFLSSLFSNVLVSGLWASVPTIIWWTPLTNQYNNMKICGSRKCMFTDRRDMVNSPETKAILFYGSNLDYYDLPLPRLKHHIWGLLHEESPKNVPYLQNKEILKYFNYTSTFSRHSDVPLTLEYLKNLDTLTTRKYSLSVEKKNEIKKERNLSSIVYLQSHCDAPSARDEYVKELMKFVKIDSYGKCLNNKNLPRSLKDDYLQTLESDELLKFLGAYKFQIAFENAACNDYITEKFWRPLISGSIPIYFGSQLIEDWLPNTKSAILIKDFPSPSALAEFIQRLDTNDHEYNKYVSHKILGSSGITNRFLLDKVSEWTRRSDEGIFSDFECFICEELHKGYAAKTRYADAKHYDCGNQLVFPPMEFDTKDFYWNSIMENGKIIARVLDDFLMANKPITANEFQRIYDVEVGNVYGINLHLMEHIENERKFGHYDYGLLYFFVIVTSFIICILTLRKLFPSLFRLNNVFLSVNKSL